eukprot:TRINITY_DN1171_c0_g1_i1.p1 TRINITY_DN1171_c0_g1~~TRINITY_DN1171_c0_g1_i1.p1  ORF type:complete len:161 (+),score=31.69 TRINITY_DN1171_c0_g1_i1:59-541(+)
MPFSKNGRCEWSQTEDEIEIKIPVMKETKSRDVNCSAKARVVTAGMTEQEHLKNAELCHPVVASDMHWQLEDNKDGRFIVMTLTKERSGLSWRALLLQDDPKPPLSDTEVAPDSSWSKSEPAVKKPSLLSTIEPGTLAACLMLFLSVCVGIFKSYVNKNS